MAQIPKRLDDDGEDNLEEIEDIDEEEEEDDDEVDALAPKRIGTVKHKVTTMSRSVPKTLYEIRNEDIKSKKQLPAFMKTGRAEPEQVEVEEVPAEVEEQVAEVQEKPAKKVQPAQKRFTAFYRQAVSGIADTQTNEAVYNVPAELLPLAEILANILNEIDEIKEMLGKL